jgi:glutamine synthetase
MINVIAEYIWIDGTNPTARIRSKTKVFNFAGDKIGIADIPQWTFDGSSTNQAPGDKSDCILVPVTFCKDPTRGNDRAAVLVLCEVYNADGTPHRSNMRHHLIRVMEKKANKEPLCGIEQEYTLFRGGTPLGWPTGGYPPQQGPYYCGVGSDEVCGRDLVEDHMKACLDAGLVICGVNAEVMPGQWEFQIGTADPVTVSDHLWLARWLLYRIGEKYGINAKLDPKPVRELNGAGAHTNWSTAATRDPESGMREIDRITNILRRLHDDYIPYYGHGIEQRLTGQHETCSYKEFRCGVSDRGASIRIPLHVAKAGCGYFEDRRPCANIDPYVVTRLLLEAS